MGITAISGPQISYGVALTSSGGVSEYNEERGPSLCDLGEGLIDPRPQFCYKPGNPVGTPTMAWAGLFGGPVVDQIPSAKSTNGIVLSASGPATNGALTIQASGPATANIAQTTLLDPTTGVSTTPWAIDGAMVNSKGVVSGVQFGSGGTIGLWDPSKAVTRALTVNFSSGGGTGTLMINGRDLYGFKMSQLVSEPTNGGAVTTLKAFKYVSSIVAASGTLTSTGIIVGVSDSFGFPMRVDTPAYLTTWWGNSTAGTVNATIVNAASSVSHAFAATATATSTTGDVRGTINPSTYAAGASNGTTNRLQMNISPSVANLAGITASNYAGLVGVVQFAAF